MIDNVTAGNFELEKKLIENNDEIQIQYLQEYKFSKNEMLVIESNATLGLTLQKHLTKLGVQNVYVCKTGSEGLKIFMKLAKLGKIIPVILSDSISDTKVKSIIQEILRIDSQTNVIIETANDRSDPAIKELFDLGVFYLIKKPIRFNDLKELMSVLEMEHETIEGDLSNLQNKLELILRNNKIISLKRISENSNEEISTVHNYLKELELHGKIASLGPINEIACNQCSSVRINQFVKCPQCQGINFGQQKLIEHYKCGETYPKNSESDRCPKCNKNIGRIGSDYRELDNYYVCADCNDKFPEPVYVLECRNCEHKFEKQHAHLEKSVNYRIFKI
ncbi:hypothetical protein YTPLAS73_00790 [Nitrosarchaeum sp.]|nr:hypothetical protein YTPLAS73_00790 [Nitrosarchaeum sp.]